MDSADPSPETRHFPEVPASRACPYLPSSITVTSDGVPMRRGIPQ